MLWETQLGNPVTPNKSQIPIFPKEPHSRAQQRAMRHSFFIYIFVCISEFCYFFFMQQCSTTELMLFSWCWLWLLMVLSRCGQDSQSLEFFSEGLSPVFSVFLHLSSMCILLYFSLKYRAKHKPTCSAVTQVQVCQECLCSKTAHILRKGSGHHLGLGQGRQTRQRCLPSWVSGVQQCPWDELLPDLCCRENGVGPQCPRAGNMSV